MRFYRLCPPSFRAQNAHTSIRIQFGFYRIAFAFALFAVVMFYIAPTAQASKISPRDTCLSFLSSGSPQGSTEIPSQRPAVAIKAAGHAATLGLLLGLGHAVGPAEDLENKARNTQRQSVSALDIKRYRTCKKEQALMLSAL